MIIIQFIRVFIINYMLYTDIYINIKYVEGVDLFSKIELYFNIVNK